MLKAGVTIGCAAAMMVAAVLAVRLRHTRRTPSPLSGSEPFGERLAITAGRTGGMLVGAFLAGVLTIGAGGRLMMRVLAATSSDDVQGLRTEADEIVGDVSVGGSMFLIVIVGIGAALVGLALFSMLRRWLPDRSLAAGLVGVAIGAGLLVRPVGLLTSANSDFTLVAPVALAVALCLATLALFGATFGVLVDCLAPRWPRPGWNPRGVVSVLPFAVLLSVTATLCGGGDRRSCGHGRAQAAISGRPGSLRAAKCRRRRRSASDASWSWHSADSEASRSSLQQARSSPSDEDRPLSPACDVRGQDPAVSLHLRVRHNSSTGACADPRGVRAR